MSDTTYKVKFTGDQAQLEGVLTALGAKFEDTGKKAEDGAKTADGALGKLKEALGNIGSAAESAGGKLAGVGEKVGKAAGIAAIAVGGLGIAGAGALLKLGSDFDSAYDKIAIGTGATGDALKGLEGDFKAAFTSVPTDMESASTAIADLNTRTGATGETLQKMAEAALEMSRITGTDLSGNIEEVTALTNNWGISGDGVTQTMNKLFVAAQSTGVSITDIAQGVTDAAGTFRQMGLSVDDSIALVAGLGKVGIDSNTAISGLTKAVGKFAKEGKDAGAGIQSAFESIKSAKTDTEAIGIAVDIFGAKAGPKLADSIRTGKFAVDDLKDAIAKSDDAIMETAASTNDFGEKLTILKNKALVALEPLANKVFALANAFVDKATPALERFGAFLQESVVPAVVAFTQSNIVPVVQDVAAAMLDLATTVADKLQGPLEAVFNFFKDNESALQALGIAVGTVLVAAFTAWGVAMGIAAVNAIIVAAPIIAIVAAVALLAAGVFLLIKHWDDITAKFPILGTVADGVKSKVEDFIGWINEHLVPAVMAIGTVVVDAVTLAVNFVRDHWDEIRAIIEPAMTALGVLIQGAWDTIEAIFTAAKDTLAGILDLLTGIFTGDFDKMKEGALEIVGALWQGVSDLFWAGVAVVRGFGEVLWGVGKDVATAIWNGVKEFWDGTIKPGWEGLWNGFKGVVGTVWGGIRGVIAEGVNGAIGIINGFISGLNSIVGPLGDFLGTISGGHIDLPDIPKIPTVGTGTAGPAYGSFAPEGSITPFAEGGIVTRPTLALIGEAGPEAVVPLSRGRGKGLGGMTVVNHFHGDIIATDEGQARRAGSWAGYGIARSLRSRGYP